MVRRLLAAALSLLLLTGKRGEEDSLLSVSSRDFEAKELVIMMDNGRWILKTNVYDLLGNFRDGIITTETLGKAFEPEQPFEHPDGTPIIFNSDFFGAHRGAAALPGPFAEGKNEMIVW